MDKNHRTIYEFWNSELLLSVSSDLIPELKRYFPERWKEIPAMAVIMAQDPRPVRYMKSSWEKL